MTRRRHALALVALAALALAVAGFWRAPADAAAAWLAAWLFALGPTLGALSLLLMLTLAGGAWSTALRPSLIASSRTLSPMLLLGVPLLYGASSLYPWLRDGAAAGQRWWFDVPAMAVALALCALFWSMLAWRLRADVPMPRAWAALAALLQLLALTVFGVDLLMALQPSFHSSSFGLEFAVAQMLAAMALVLLLGPRLAGRAAGTASGVLLMLSLLWTYLHFMAYLTIWTADLPDEIVWVLPRTQTSWGGLTALGGILQGPLTILALAIPALRRGRGLRVIALCVLLGSAIEMQVAVGAAVHPSSARFGVYQALALLGILLSWLWCFLRRQTVGDHVAEASPAAASRVAIADLPRRSRRQHAQPAAHHASDWQAETQWDVPARLAWRLSLGAVVLMAGLLAAIYAYWGVLFADEQKGSEHMARQMPPLPRLQLHAPDDREALQAAQRRWLESYGWVDRAHGIAHIPIERAMQQQAAQENGS